LLIFNVLGALDFEPSQADLAGNRGLNEGPHGLTLPVEPEALHFKASSKGRFVVSKESKIKKFLEKRCNRH
jgi:hypothetical protein